MSPRELTILRNLQWLYANKRDDADGLHVDSDVFVRGDGGFELEALADPSLTPAGRES